LLWACGKEKHGSRRAWQGKITQILVARNIESEQGKGLGQNIAPEKIPTVICFLLLVPPPEVSTTSNNAIKLCDFPLII
jgi:hypothetical protein